MAERLHYFNEATTIVSFECSDSDIESDVEDPRRLLNASDRAKQHALQLQLWSDAARDVRARRRTLSSRGCPSDRQQSNLSSDQSRHRSSSLGRSHSCKSLRIRVTPSSSSRSLLSDVSAELSTTPTNNSVSVTPSSSTLPISIQGHHHGDNLNLLADERYSHGVSRRPVRVQNGPGPRGLPPMEYKMYSDDQDQDDDADTDKDQGHEQSEKGIVGVGHETESKDKSKSFNRARSFAMMYDKQTGRASMGDGIVDGKCCQIRHRLSGLCSRRAWSTTVAVAEKENSEKGAGSKASNGAGRVSKRMSTEQCNHQGGHRGGQRRWTWRWKWGRA